MYSTCFHRVVSLLTLSSSQSVSDIDVFVLAGGMGTRLRGVLADAPKVLAPILGKPFLEHLIRWLAGQGCRRITLGLGYRAPLVVEWLATAHMPDIDVRTVVEPEPLGTGGALAFARSRLTSNPVLVINGDTVVEADLNAFLSSHLEAKTEASILSVNVDNAGRYGMLQIDSANRVVRFDEKDVNATGSHWINAGFYLFSEGLLDRVAGRIHKGSLERDILEEMPAGSVLAFRTEGRFLDIGTPETLALAPELLGGIA